MLKTSGIDMSTGSLGNGLGIAVGYVFGESGKPDDLLSKFGMDVDDLVSAAKTLVEWKKGR
jgi:transketolase